MGLFSIKAQSPEQISKHIVIGDKPQHGQFSYFGDTLFVSSFEAPLLTPYHQESQKLYYVDKDVHGEHAQILARQIGTVILTQSYYEPEQFVEVAVPIGHSGHASRYYPINEYFESTMTVIPNEFAYEIAARAVYDIAQGTKNAYKDQVNAYYASYIKSLEAIKRFV